MGERGGDFWPAVFVSAVVFACAAVWCGLLASRIRALESEVATLREAIVSVSAGPTPDEGEAR